MKKLPFGKRVFTLSMLLVALAFSYAGVYAQTIDDSILKTFQWRNIGPANMGGRTVNLAGVDSNPKIIYAATATSGIWKTVNRGTTWEPIFDDYPVATVGAIAVSQKDPNILYAGTGESNGRNSSPWGKGVYKSTNAGASWEFVGLENTRHISRIIIDPDNVNVVYVAAMGHLWAPNEDRGVFKTTNGGETWEKILYIDENTGIIDIAMDPRENDLIYAASYEILRDGFSGGNPEKRWGPGSGIHITTNAGRSWERATNGLPDVDMGRIGLSISRSKPGTIYAIIETASQGGGRGGGRGGRGGGGRGGGGQENRPNEINRGGIFKSTNKGRSWNQQSEYNSRPFYYSQIRVDPNDDESLWFGGTALGRSSDGGKNVRSGAQVSGPTHIDYHAIWIDPNDSEHVVLGSDGGISVTYDDGQTWDMYMQQPMAQFYAITADMRKPYFVFGGLQDNGSWGGPSRTRSRYGIRNEDWFMLSWGDGFYAQVDPTDPNIVYTESQGGAVRRNDISIGQTRSIRPSTQNISNLGQYYPDLQRQLQESGRGGRGGGGRGGGGRGGGNNPFRFDWNSPLMISQHNPKTLYFGGNHLFKSLNRGDNWMIVSPDLTLREEKGDNKARAITSIDESPINPNVLWAGSNDGNVWVTRNGGVNWTKLNDFIPNVPHEYWVKRVEASNHEEGRAYLVFDGHRNDDPTPYVYVTEDFGRSWRNISNNIPDEATYVIREDYKNPNLLFLGTSSTVYVSLDRGNNWTRFMNNMPTVEIHDLYIHPRDGDLIAGTHGRGAWIADNITALQEFTPEVMEKSSHLFAVRPATIWATPTGQYPYQSDKMFKGDNPPNGPFISYYFQNQGTTGQLVISDVTGENQRTISLTDGAGLHTFQWNRRFDPSESQRRQYISSANQNIDQRLQNADEEQKTQLEQFRIELNNSGTDLEQLRDFQSRFAEVFGGGGRGGGRGRGGRGGGGGNLNGGTAGIGEYLVTFTSNGLTMTTTLVIEEDKPGYIVR